MTTNPEGVCAAFEKWAWDEGFDLDTFTDSGEYVEPDTCHAWLGYQASVSHQGPVVAVGELEALRRYENADENDAWIDWNDLRNLINKAGSV